jgi:putative flippase GtrA
MAQSTIEMIEMDKQSQKDRKFSTPLDGFIEKLGKRFGGNKPKELERFIKFAIVGITGAVVDLGILTILQMTILPPAAYLSLPLDFNLVSLPIDFNISATPLDVNVALATTVAFISAVISNFIWTTRWVYPESRGRGVRRQLIQFASISVIGWLARTLWITLTYVMIGALVSPIIEPIIQIFKPSYVVNSVSEKGLGSIVAQLIAMVFVMLWNFFANRYWTFNDVDKN